MIAFDKVSHTVDDHFKKAYWSVIEKNTLVTPMCLKHLGLG